MGEVISIIWRQGGGSPGNKPERAMQMMTRPLAKMNPKAVANVAGMDIWYCIMMKIDDENRIVQLLLIIEYLYSGEGCGSKMMLTASMVAGSTRNIRPYPTLSGASEVAVVVPSDDMGNEGHTAAVKIAVAINVPMHAKDPTARSGNIVRVN